LNIELIILAAIAVFVISRLYAVLGQKTGAEPPARRLREAPARAPEPLPALPPPGSRKSPPATPALPLMISPRAPAAPTS
jgi:hypothetical protein